MKPVTVSIRIGATPEEVSEILLDADRAPEWTSGLERLELVAGEPGAPGAMGIAHYREGRRRYDFEDELVGVDPNRYYVSRITGGGVTATVETTLVPIGECGTRMTLRWAGEGTTPLSRLLLPLARRRIARRAYGDLSALRRLAEHT